MHCNRTHTLAYTHHNKRRNKKTPAPHPRQLHTTQKKDPAGQERTVRPMVEPTREGTTRWDSSEAQCNQGDTHTHDTHHCKNVAETRPFTPLSSTQSLVSVESDNQAQTHTKKKETKRNALKKKEKKELLRTHKKTSTAPSHQQKEKRMKEERERERDARGTIERMARVWNQKHKKERKSVVAMRPLCTTTHAAQKTKQKFNVETTQGKEKKRRRNEQSRQKEKKGKKKMERRKLEIQPKETL